MKAKCQESSEEAEIIPIMLEGLWQSKYRPTLLQMLIVGVLLPQAENHWSDGAQHCYAGIDPIFLWEALQLL